jgi:ZIP family zinc transporter
MDLSQENIVFALSLTFLTGITTIIGSIVAHFVKSPKYQYLGFALGCSAGGIVGVTMVEVLYKITTLVGPFKTNLAFIAGMIFSLILTFIFKHEKLEQKIGDANIKILGRDVVTSLGLLIHNVPEGIMVLFAALLSIETGIFVAIAVAMHNIAQGFSLSISTFYITQDTKRAFLYSSLSGFLEPFGAVIILLSVIPFLSTLYLNLSLAFISGIMIYVSLGELIPFAHKYGGERSIFVGIIWGMSIMILILSYIRLFQ